MDQLRALILRFKEYNGSVAANFEILAPYFEDEHNMSDDLTSTFDVMSYHLCKTYIRLSQATVYGTLARQLFVARNYSNVKGGHSRKLCRCGEGDMLT